MRRIAVACLLVSFTLGASVACDSDPGTGDSTDEGDGWTADAESAPDTSEPPSDAAEDTGDEPPVDVEEDTSMEPGPDSGADATDATGTDAATDAGTDTSTSDATTYPDGGDVGPDALPSTFGPGSFLRHFYIDDKQGERSQTQGRCCYDYESGQFDNGTENDNALADLLANVGSFVGIDLDTINGSINQQIENGAIIYLFEYLNWDPNNVRNDGDIEMRVHKGADAQSPFQDNLKGSGTFDILTSSYRPNGQPKWRFATASTQNGRLRASGGNVALNFELFFGVTVRLRLKDPQLKAKVATGGNLDVQPGGTVPLKNGKLAGKIPKADLYDGLNKAVSPCMCLGGQDLLVRQSGDTFQCTSKQGSCQCSSQLEQIIDRCPLIRSAISGAADYDTNSNSGTDALSVGASFDAVGAEIIGVTQ